MEPIDPCRAFTGNGGMYSRTSGRGGTYVPSGAHRVPKRMADTQPQRGPLSSGHACYLQSIKSPIQTANPASRQSAISTNYQQRKPFTFLSLLCNGNDPSSDKLDHPVAAQTSSSPFARSNGAYELLLSACSRTIYLLFSLPHRHFFSSERASKPFFS